MKIDPETFKEEDGGYSLTIDGKPTRLVLESDLLALKGANEAKSKEWDTQSATLNTQIAEANKAIEASHQKLLQEQANREKFESEAKEVAGYKLRLSELEKESETHKTAREKAESELTGFLRETFSSKYKVDPKKLESMTLDQLRSAQSTLSSLGITPSNAQPRYDHGGNPPGGGSAESGLDRARRIIEENEAKHGRVKVTTPT